MQSWRTHHSYDTASIQLKPLRCPNNGLINFKNLKAIKMAIFYPVVLLMSFEKGGRCFIKLSKKSIIGNQGWLLGGRVRLNSLQICQFIRTYLKKIVQCTCDQKKHWTRTVLGSALGWRCLDPNSCWAQNTGANTDCWKSNKVFGYSFSHYNYKKKIIPIRFFEQDRIKQGCGTTHRPSLSSICYIHIQGWIEDFRQGGGQDI